MDQTFNALRGEAYRTNVLHYKQTNAAHAVADARSFPQPMPAIPHYESVEAMVNAMRPSEPVYCIRPHIITHAATWFLNHFPGDVLFAVKTNPDPRVLRTLAMAGVTHYDVASLA